MFFNDVSADIKNILHGENRLEEFIGFSTPKYKDSISATFNQIKNPLASGANFKSYSINYFGDGLSGSICCRRWYERFLIVLGCQFCILIQISVLELLSKKLKIFQPASKKVAE